jgi:hypothetical protein
MKAFTTFTFTAVLLAAPLVHADPNFAAVDDGDHIVSVTTGAEHGLVLGLGYGRALSLAGRPIVVGASAALQWAEVDASDFRIAAGARVPIAGDRWRVIGGIDAIVRGADNDVARLINTGVDISLLAGRYGDRWFAAVEAGFDWALATRVDHTDAYRMQVYADARDGWYGNTGGTFRYGIQGGATFGGNDIVLRAGKLHGIDGAPAVFPIYATLGYDRRW